jgi:hypothetical protein
MHIMLFFVHHFFLLWLIKTIIVTFFVFYADLAVFAFPLDSAAEMGHICPVLLRHGLLMIVQVLHEHVGLYTGVLMPEEFLIELFIALI